MNLELIKEKISDLQDNNVKEITIDYDTYSLKVEAMSDGDYVIKYKDIPITKEYVTPLLLKMLERYEFYPKSYFEDILSKKEEYYKKSRFVNKINDDIENLSKEIFDLNKEIEYYKEVNGGIEENNYYKINFYHIENEVNKIKDNYNDLLYNYDDLL